MKKLFLWCATALVAVSVVHAEEAPAPIPPLVARYVTADNGLVIGGGPESADIASDFGHGVAARVVGPAGSVPLLTHGVIALAVLPRTMTDGERAAMKRFTGGEPLAVPVMRGLWAYVRRDAAGGIDRKVAPLLTALLSEEGQETLAKKFQYLKPLSHDELATAQKSVATVAVHEVAVDERAAEHQHIAVIGSDTLVTLWPSLERGFKERHSQLVFSTDLRGSSLAIPALIAGVSAFAPMGREAWQEDLDAFRQAKGYDVIRIRVAYASHGPRSSGKTPPAVYVNKNNPLRGLSWEQVQHLFAAMYPQEAYKQWSVFGLKQPEWLNAPIHVYGVNEKSSFAVAMQQSKLNGLPFSPFYRSLPNGKAVLDAVAHDPYGIGYSTWVEGGKTPDGVRLLPLSASAHGPFVLPDGVSDRSKWPISYFFNIYLDCAPGQHLPQNVKAFLLYVLSEDGQKVIAAHQEDEDGYLPLSQGDLQAERRVINRL